MCKITIACICGRSGAVAEQNTMREGIRERGKERGKGRTIPGNVEKGLNTTDRERRSQLLSRHASHPKGRVEHLGAECIAI